MGSRSGSSSCRHRPDFTEPMAGETLAHFKTVEANVGKLWDGWLQIMEMLDKAQKLEAKAGSPLSTKALSDVEEMVNRARIVRGDRDPGPGFGCGAGRAHSGSSRRRVRSSMRSPRPGPRSTRRSSRSRSSICRRHLMRKSWARSMPGRPRPARSRPAIRWEPGPRWNSFGREPMGCSTGSNGLCRCFAMPSKPRPRSRRSPARWPATGRKG